VVPSVTGEQLNLARAVLQSAGFHVAVIRVQSSHTAGVVIGELPGAGSSADKNSTVTVSVSQGPGNQSVPTVLGLSQAKATRQITRAKLKVVNVVRQPSQRFSAGQAIGTDPASGTTVPIGQGVTLIVSSGQAPKAIPDVTGQSQANATTTLTSAGFKVSSSTQNSSTVSNGDVISQNPAAGTSAAPGTTVQIVVATAPATSTVPPVVGDPAAGARSALEAAGFTVGQTTRTVTNKSQDGNVVSQTPAGGSTAKKHSTVTIVVGRYKAPRSSSSSSTTTTTSSSSTTTTTTTSSTTPTATSTTKS
jgi:beta-lactam-binding protein with PASTA domain